MVCPELAFGLGALHVFFVLSLMKAWLQVMKKESASSLPLSNVVASGLALPKALGCDRWGVVACSWKWKWHISLKGHVGLKRAEQWCVAARLISKMIMMTCFATVPSVLEETWVIYQVWWCGLAAGCWVGIEWMGWFPMTVKEGRYQSQFLASICYLG